MWSRFRRSLAAATLLCLAVALPTLAQVGGNGTPPPMQHVLLLDVSGSMNSKTSGGGYGGIGNGYRSGQPIPAFSNNIVELFKGLLKSDDKYFRSGDKVVLMPVADQKSLTEEKRSDVSQNVNIGNFADMLGDNKVFPGPGTGAWGEGIGAPLNRAQTKYGGSDGNKEVTVYWILTDNGADNASADTPRDFYRLLQHSQAFSHVWCAPLLTLEGGKSPLVLYVVVETASLINGWTDGFYEALDERLKGMGRYGAFTFKPFSLITKASEEDTDQAPLRIEVRSHQTARGLQPAAGEEDGGDAGESGTSISDDDSFVTAEIDENGRYVVDVEMEDGQYAGRLRFKPYAPNGWKFDNLRVSLRSTNSEVVNSTLLPINGSSSEGIYRCIEFTAQPEDFEPTETFADSSDSEQTDEVDDSSDSGDDANSSDSAGTSESAGSEGEVEAELVLHGKLGGESNTSQQSTSMRPDVPDDILNSAPNLRAITEYMLFGAAAVHTDVEKKVRDLECDPIKVVLRASVSDGIGWGWAALGVGVLLAGLGLMAFLLLRGKSTEYTFSYKYLDGRRSGETGGYSFTLGGGSGRESLRIGTDELGLVSSKNGRLFMAPPNGEEQREVVIGDSYKEILSSGEKVSWQVLLGKDLEKPNTGFGASGTDSESRIIL